MKDSTQLLSAVVVAAGLAAGGWFAADAFVRARAAERFVTVKGVAEREVQADLALWPMQFVVAEDDLARARVRNAEGAEKVTAFLARHGLGSQQVELQELDVLDTQAQRYGGAPAPRRYVITQTIMVRSANPQTVFDASQKIGELVEGGVVLSSEGQWSAGPTYLFTKLNELKPAMIAEATANARQSAEQFAKDSGSTLRGIRQANQGLFVILPRDQAPGVQQERQRTKIVRVVTTVDYRLGG